MEENSVRCQDAATYWRNIVANHGSLVEIVFLVVYFIFTLHQKEQVFQESFPVWRLGAQDKAEASIKEITRPKDDSD